MSFSGLGQSTVSFLHTQFGFGWGKERIVWVPRLDSVLSINTLVARNI